MTKKFTGYTMFKHEDMDLLKEKIRQQAQIEEREKIKKIIEKLRWREGQYSNWIVAERLLNEIEKLAEKKKELEK